MKPLESPAVSLAMITDAWKGSPRPHGNPEQGIQRYPFIKLFDDI